MVSKLVELENTEELKDKEKKLGDAEELKNERKKSEILKKLIIGRRAFIKNIEDIAGDDLGAAVALGVECNLTKDKDGNILINDKPSEANRQKIQKGWNEKSDQEKWKASVKIRLMEKLSKNELIKKALTVPEPEE